MSTCSILLKINTPSWKMHKIKTSIDPHIDSSPPTMIVITSSTSSTTLWSRAPMWPTLQASKGLLISGMIMLGHIHVYEIMMREIFPLFLDIIDDQSLSRNHESQMGRFQESMLKVNQQEKKTFIQIRRKIKQFCKETILLLSMWFPKDFYDPALPSWFKKVVAKYQINCNFSVYYNDENINQYEAMIQKLRLDVWEAECLQCTECIQTKGENYDFLKKVLTFSSFMIKDSKIQSQEKVQIPEMKTLMKNILDKKVIKRKNERKSKINSIFGLNEKTKEQSLSKHEETLYCQSKLSPDSREEDLIKKSKSQMNIEDLRLKMRERRKTKRKDKLKSQRKSEGTLKIFSKKQFPKMNTIFGQEFSKLGAMSKKFFRKECLRRRKKIMTYNEEGVTIEIRTKSKGSCLEVKLTGFDHDQERVSIKLLSPLNGQNFLKKRLNVYTFNFQHSFIPIVVSINNREVVIPIFQFELLEGVQGYHQDIRNLSYSQEVKVTMDEDLFRDEDRVGELLGLERVRDQYVGFFRYGDSLLELVVERTGKQTYLHGRISEGRELFLTKLLQQMKSCLQE